MKTHIPHQHKRITGEEKTFCGRRIYGKPGICITGDKVFPHLLKCIGPNEVIDAATCKACQRVDDARQVADYRRDLRERAEAGDRDAAWECAELGIR